MMHEVIYSGVALKLILGHIGFSVVDLDDSIVVRLLCNIR